MDEKDIERFVEILNGGGVLIAHPDTLADFRRNTTSHPLLAAIIKSIGRPIEYVPNRWVESGLLFACVKQRFDAASGWPRWNDTGNSSLSVPKCGRGMEGGDSATQQVGIK